MRTFVLLSLLLTLGFCSTIPDPEQVEESDLDLDMESRDLGDRDERIFRVKDTNPPKPKPLLLSKPVAVLKKLRKPSDILPQRPQVHDGNRLPILSSGIKNIPSKLSGLKTFWKTTTTTTSKPYVVDYNNKPTATYTNQQSSSSYYTTDPYYAYQIRDSYYNGQPYYNPYESTQLLAVPISSLSSGKSDSLLGLIRDSTIIGTIKL